MNLDRLVLSVAGSFILLSVMLSVIYSPYWLFFTAFVGVNLLQASFTGFCPLVLLLKKVGVRSGHAFSQFPSGNGPLPDERRSPRTYFLNALSVRLVVNPCAALLTGKIAHFQIGNLFVSILISGQTRISLQIRYWQIIRRVRPKKGLRQSVQVIH